MGRSRFFFADNTYPYFVTSSVNEHFSLFVDPVLADIILRAITYLQTGKGVVVFGYVIMVDHIHMIIHSKNSSSVMRDFKSFTSRMILESLKSRGYQRLLEKLKFHKRRHKHQSTYQVWQEGSHPIQIDSFNKMNQCLDYIHNNPVKAGLVTEPLHWRYSSIHNYHQLDGLIPVSVFSG